ncbi:unnamed protein product [Penicillium salamii]|uniref:TauD/TfdA-like domain-containing protein n=1 Tax=Penicillium salamii TaxID=1612424 RepID=A0A9W4I5R4_9EURO|nr:unnamed protein product [Penicillium salamii]CAG8361351.1 unnamed protein product [Penicillium salamii]CAG8362259.1 unnamed protein product [Penicillium salamii]CAG8368808.1 unnamed protein product [Penicillium salamii]
MQSLRRTMTTWLLPQSTRWYSTTIHSTRQVSKLAPVVPHLKAQSVLDPQNPHHANEVDHHLQTHGVLKITLEFSDNESQYLESLVKNLGTRHGHGPPITHSATRGWFWDVRPTTTSLAKDNRARSETMSEFPWHTDCSYEHDPPQFFALQVLQPDRCGGGTLSALRIERVCSLLSADAQSALFKPEFEIKIPPEFVKDPTKGSILGSILSNSARDKSIVMRYREDIIAPITASASLALKELRSALKELELSHDAILHLKSEDMPEGSIILFDNRRWLHARNQIKDPNRHLRRVRWNAIPFSG